MGKLVVYKTCGTIPSCTSLKILQFCPTCWMGKMKILDRYVHFSEHAKEFDKLLSNMFGPHENVTIQSLADSSRDDCSGAICF